MRLVLWSLAWYVGIQVVLGVTDQPGMALIGLTLMAALFSLVQLILVMTGLDKSKA